MTYKPGDLKRPIWTKTYTINFFVNFLVNFCMFLLIVIIAGYSKERFHTSDSLAGLVSGIFIVGSLIGRFSSGRYVNSVGPKKILVFGSILLIISQLLYFYDSSLSFLILTRLINGIAMGITTTATGTIAGFITPHERKSEGISLFSLSLVIGQAIGPFIALLVFDAFSITYIFFINIIVGVISLLFSLFVKVDYPTAAPTPEEKGFKPSNFIAKEALPVALFMLLTGLAFSSVLSFLQLMAQERDLVQASSYFFIVYAIVSLLTRPFVGKIMDARNENAVAYPAFIAFAICFIIIAFANQNFILLIAGAIMGLGYGNIVSTCQTISVKLVPVKKIGIATSTFFIGLDLGLGFGPFVLGIFTNTIGFQNLYLYMAILMIITMIIYYVLHGRKVKKVTTLQSL